MTDMHGSGDRRPGAALVEELKASGALDSLFARIDAGDVELMGDDGVLPELVRTALERGLQAEMTSHLGYEPGDRAAKQGTNSRNGTTAKTVASTVGEFQIAVPRDREGSFTPRLVAKGQRRLGGLDDMIISLYAGGMTVRDIQHHLATTVGTELSHETIANITDAVADAVLAWQRRPLEAFYPVMYLDAIRVKVRDGGHVASKAAHIAVGVDMEGIKHVLGIWVQDTEGASFWASVCAELANRGVSDVLIVCCDGLAGFPEAIGATWPDAMIQTCVVHLIRASMRFVSYGDRKRVAAALKPVYTAPTVDAADVAFEQFAASPRQEIPVNGGDVEGRMGPVHPVLGIPAHGASRHLHDELDRIVELPAAESHEEPLPVPQRRRGRQATLACDLQ